MTARTQFYIVDVFAEQQYAGNQLAVFRGGDRFSDEEMQKIAREMNFSETTFITKESPAGDGGYGVRIFTPVRELPFAGHPTLGTAFIIQKEIIGHPVKMVKLNVPAGQIPVDFPAEESEPLWMTQLPPEFSETYDAETVAPLLNLTTEEIDTRYPVQVVSTGTPFILVPLKTLAAVKKARLNRELYFEFVADKPAKSLFFFAPAAYSPENHLHVRLFADYYGVPEDPATGSACGCLAGYLVKYRVFGKPKVDVRVEQGYEIGRPSLLHLRAAEAGSNIRIQVGGRVIWVAKGQWL